MKKNKKPVKIVVRDREIIGWEYSQGGTFHDAWQPMTLTEYLLWCIATGKKPNK